jgi:hypothetical protein
MANNPCSKRVTPETAYEVWQSYNGTFTYFVLKKYQSPEQEAKNPYARWYCMVLSPATTARGDIGDAYVATVKDGTSQVINNPLALPLRFHLHAEKPSSTDNQTDCYDVWFEQLAEAQRHYKEALKTYPFVQLLIDNWKEIERDGAPMESACLLSHGRPLHSPTHTDEQTSEKEAAQ